MDKIQTTHTGDKPYAQIQQEAETWWLTLRSGKATTEDAKALRLWCAQSDRHAKAWREIRDTWDTLGAAAALARHTEPALGRAPVTRERRFMPSSKMGRRAFIGGALAAPAMVALAVQPPLGLWPSLAALNADYRTGTGQARQLALSDRVLVQMNTQTQINRQARAGDGIVLVRGEAEILVERGQPVFTVDVGGGELRTQLARLNVRYTGPDVCVTCFNGQVDIAVAGERKTLVAGEQVVFDRHSMQAATQVSQETAPTWRSGALNFVDVPLAEVVDEINRYRSGRVILHNTALAQRQVRMRFAINQTDSALHMISELYGAQLTKLPAGVVLIS